MLSFIHSRLVAYVYSWCIYYHSKCIYHFIQCREIWHKLFSITFKVYLTISTCFIFVIFFCDYLSFKTDLLTLYFLKFSEYAIFHFIDCKFISTKKIFVFSGNLLNVFIIVFTCILLSFRYHQDFFFLWLVHINSEIFCVLG